MMEQLHLDSIITYRNFKNKTVEEILNSNKKLIFQMIKNDGYYFDDEVLARANITRKIRDVQVVQEIVKHDVDKNKGKLRKDTAPLSEVLKEVLKIGEVDMN